MTVTVQLFKSDNCVYCQKFEPTWNLLENSLKNMNVKSEVYDAKLHEDVMLKKKVKGFPTIRMEKTDNGKTESFEYNGSRNVDSIINALSSFVGQTGGVRQEENWDVDSPFSDDFQDGGAKNNDNDYEMKYKTYKTKYLNLKKWMNEMGYE